MCKKFSSEDEIKIREQLSYDPLSGIVTRISKPKGSKAILGPIKGIKKPEGHLKTCICGKEVYLHQLAWFLHYGVWASKILDHKDRDPSNNRIKNLREVDHQKNMQNRSDLMKSSSSGFLGVYFDKSRSKFVAEITINNQKKYLGRFATAELAHEAYIAAKRQHHKGFV